MEDELWKGLYFTVMKIANKFRPKYVQYRDSVIVLTYLWAVLHDRPICWACEPKNWPENILDYDLPSQATMSNRLRMPSVQQFMHEVEQHIHDLFPSSGWCKWIDALPLPVGNSTQDRQARPGWAAGMMGKGYKLHAICDPQAGIDSWKIYPMNVSEKNVAEELFCQLSGQGYIVADGCYDINRLYDKAGLMGYQLLATRRIGNALGHRRHSGYRLRAFELLDHAFGRCLLQQRFGIDRFFGQWGNFYAGLKPLPHWVRGLHRVRLWIQGKIIINAVRLAQKQRLTA